MWRVREAGDAVDTVIITPEKGRHKEVGQRLYALAERTSDIQWVTWPVAGFQVPVELFNRFERDVETPAETAEEAAEEPAPKRRGRPPKAKPEPEPDNTSEKEE